MSDGLLAFLIFSPIACIILAIFAYLCEAHGR